MTDPNRDLFFFQITCKGKNRPLRLSAELLMLCGVNVLDVQENQICDLHEPVKPAYKSL